VENDDAISFGIMWTMAHGNLQDWLAPNIAGLAMPAESPLAYWLGAICIKLFGWLLSDPLAARISTIICFLVGSLSIWYATYLLGRRSEAQPLKLAFGGQPEPKDFGRMLADGAFLIYLGFLGLLLHSHETSAKTLQSHWLRMRFTVPCACRYRSPLSRDDARPDPWPAGLDARLAVAGGSDAGVADTRRHPRPPVADLAAVHYPACRAVVVRSVGLVDPRLVARSSRSVRYLDELEYLSAQLADLDRIQILHQIRRLVCLAGMAICRLGSLCLAPASAFAAYCTAAGVPDSADNSGLAQRPQRRRHSVAAVVPCWRFWQHSACRP